MKTILSVPMNIFRAISSVFSMIGSQISAFVASFQKPMATSVLSLKGFIFALVVGLFVAILAIGVQPFGLSEFSHADKTFILAGFGFVAFLGMLFAKFVIPFILKGFYDEQKWTVGKQVLHVIGILLIISTLMIVYSNYLNIKEFDFLDSLILVAFGIIPVYIFTITQQKVYENKFFGTAESITQNLKNIKIEESKQVLPVMIFGKGKGHQLSIVPNQLIYAETSENSTDFYYQNFTGIEKATIHASLAEIEKELASHPQFVRLGRNQVVNLRGIQKVEGDARGYKLRLARLNREIPVLRKFHKKLEKIG